MSAEGAAARSRARRELRAAEPRARPLDWRRVRRERTLNAER
jgi:hypothetical protein